VHQAQYNEETQKLAQEFEDDLFDEFGVSDNPKRHKCFNLAWENGHAHGLREVYNYFGDYVELIKD
jgi:NifU-like protein involved in Fe-S cluster formation